MTNRAEHSPRPETSTERFTARVGDYARHRPSYPEPAAAAVVEGLPAASWAADIGAGTGISTVMLLERGLRVHAVEPNDAMRRRGEAETVRYGDRVVWNAGTGERTGLPDRSVSLVLCAQSLHWLDGTAAMREFARLLEPGGRAVALWNVHDVKDPAMSAYRDVVMAHARDVPRSPWFRNDMCVLGTEAARSAGFGGYRLTEFPNGQALSLDGLIGRAMSSSYMPAEGAARAAAEADLRALFDRHASGGVFTMRYVCEVHTAIFEGGRSDGGTR